MKWCNVNSQFFVKEKGIKNKFELKNKIDNYACYGNLMSFLTGGKYKDSKCKLVLKLFGEGYYTEYDGKKKYSVYEISKRFADVIFPHFKEIYNIVSSFDEKKGEFTYIIPSKQFREEAKVGPIVHYLCDMTRLCFQFPQNAIVMCNVYEQAIKSGFSRSELSPEIINQIHSSNNLFGCIIDRGHMYCHSNNGNTIYFLDFKKMYDYYNHESRNLTDTYAIRRDINIFKTDDDLIKKIFDFYIMNFKEASEKFTSYNINNFKILNYVKSSMQ